jgi:hypothetical protein
MKLTFNGKAMTSPGQFSRELEKTIRATVDQHVKSAAPPGVKLRKTREGYIAEGDADDIQKMVKRLGK